MLKTSEQVSQNKEPESLNMFPSVIDYYNKKKKDWAKDGLTSEQQLKTARQINDVMTIIHRAITLGYYNVRHYNEMAELLDRQAKHFFNSPSERLRVFGGAEHLLRQGDEAMQKICGWYETYPEVYAEKMALNKSGLKLDKLKKFFHKDAVPSYSFLPFAKGENPAFSYYAHVWDKVLEIDTFKKTNDHDIYKKWLQNSKSGKKYAYDKMVYGHALIDLTLQAHDYLGVEEKSLRSKTKER